MRRRPASVRTRIVLASVVVVGAVLTVASVLLVQVVGSLLERPMRGEARARAADVAIAAPGRRALPPLVAPWPTMAQVVASDGRVLVASEQLAGLPALLQVTAREREPSGTTTFRYGDRPQRFRLDAVVATVAGQRRSVVVATSLGQVDRVTSTLSAALAVGVPVLVLMVAGLAWLSVGRALRPVESLRREVAALARTRPQRAAGDGPRPAAPPAHDDEIARLASTLDGLLGQLEHQRDTQRRFVADASHELRSPVANIRTALDVALAHPGSRPVPELLADVYAQNERMARLVDDLLVLARAEAGQLEPRTAVVALAGLASAVVGEVGAALGEAGAAPDGPVVRIGRLDEAAVLGDEQQLRRVLVNLVDNARRHARREVTVSVVTTGRHVRLIVGDDGAGVPAEDRARIFQRFVRLDADRSRPRGGSGLGLAIVAELVASHGGTITVAGGGPGAVFTIRLPRTDAPALSASSQVRSGTVPPCD